MDSPGKRALALKPLRVAGFHGTLPLALETQTLGRAADNDVVLAGDEFPSVSAHHTRLSWQHGELWAEDLGSRNGTVVNGEPIERRRLVAGDVLRLGPVGPRFLVAATSLGGLEETAFVDPAQVGAGSAAAERRSRRNLALALGLTAAVGLSLALALWWQDRQRRDLDAARDQELAQAREVIDSLSQQQQERERRYRAAEQQREAREASLRDEVARLMASRDELAGRLEGIEGSGAVGQENAELIAGLRQDLEGARTDLADARRQVSLFDPVNLEASRLSRVAELRRAVVLLESRTELVFAPTGELLHMAETVSGPDPNFDGRGQPWRVESTGSGFCVSEDGWILTNAHVTRTPDDDPVLRSLKDLPLVPRQTLWAVFSDTGERREARVERLAEGGVDLALVHIEPFEGMPYLEDFDIQGEVPPTGSDVFLFGFPLGHYALQEGERVIASTFRGILSRQVDGVLQVDAGVHPGNSGGPITDASGRVVGVVFSVQSLPDRTAVFTIGYGLPIGDARDLWPPPAAPTRPFLPALEAPDDLEEPPR